MLQVGGDRDWVHPGSTGVCFFSLKAINAEVEPKVESMLEGTWTPFCDALFRVPVRRTAASRWAQRGL